MGNKRFVWQRSDIPRSLIKLSTAYCGDVKTSKKVKEMAKWIFANIRGYMRDIYHPYPVTLGEEIVQIGCNEELLRDEIFCQLIKQTTRNESNESILLGMKLFFLCISTYIPSKDLSPYVLSHLAQFACRNLQDATHEYNDTRSIATHCWIAYNTIVVANRTENLDRTVSIPGPTFDDLRSFTLGQYTTKDKRVYCMTPQMASRYAKRDIGKNMDNRNSTKRQNNDMSSPPMPKNHISLQEKKNSILSPPTPVRHLSMQEESSPLFENKNNHLSPSIPTTHVSLVPPPVSEERESSIMLPPPPVPGERGSSTTALPPPLPSGDSGVFPPLPPGDSNVFPPLPPRDSDVLPPPPPPES